jgi:hypothetical protein
MTNLNHDPEPFVANFVPVSVRHRSDGWTTDRQVAFIEALAQSGCVADAAKSVGLSVRSAYALRQHSFANSFRAAWDAAINFAIKRLSDEALSRAIHGVSRAVIYKGEVVGERRYYDERLTMFLLRYRDPVTYGKFRDTMHYEQRPDGPANILSLLTIDLAREEWAADFRAAKAGEGASPDASAEVHA